MAEGSMCQSEGLQQVHEGNLVPILPQESIYGEINSLKTGRQCLKHETPGANVPPKRYTCANVKFQLVQQFERGHHGNYMRRLVLTILQ